jgi:hypothetical protein
VHLFCRERSVRKRKTGSRIRSVGHLAITFMSGTNAPEIAPTSKRTSN